MSKMTTDKPDALTRLLAEVAREIETAFVAPEVAALKKMVEVVVERYERSLLRGSDGTLLWASPAAEPFYEAFNAIAEAVMDEKGDDDGQ